MTAKTKTESELMFEDFCRRAAIRCERVPRAKAKQSPDYDIWLGSQRVVVEVKQFNPNDEERENAEARERGEIIAQGPKMPGNRVRGAIRTAAPQLKERSGGKVPTMVVVYNNTDMGLHTKPEAVEMAMFGQVEVPVMVPPDPSESPSFGSERFDARSPTPEDNAAISAVAVLRTNWDDTPALLVYHNPHATHPIGPDGMQSASVRHYRRPDPASPGCWEEA